MSEPIRDQLYQAYQLVKAGKKADAQVILVPILQEDENNADAWWLLANALDDPGDIREALETVLRLKPGYAAAEKKLAALNAKFSPVEADPFADIGIEVDSASTRRTEPLDESFDVLDRKPINQAKTRSKSNKGTNPLVIVLAVVGGLALCVCLACVGFFTIGPAIMGPAVEDIFGDITLTLEAGGDFNLDGFNTGNVRQQFQNNIAYGEAWAANLNSGVEHTYTFSGSAGDRVVITMVATNASQNLDPYITLYDSTGNAVGTDDDSAGNLDAELDYTLTSSGSYTIGAGSWSGTTSGDYEIRLIQR